MTKSQIPMELINKRGYLKQHRISMETLDHQISGLLGLNLINDIDSLRHNIGLYDVAYNEACL